MSDKRGFLVAWLGALFMVVVATVSLFVASSIVADAAAPAPPRAPIKTDAAVRASSSEREMGKGDHNFKIAFGGYERTFLVHTPDGYGKDDHEPLPVIIMLHGAGGSGANAARQTGWDRKADKEKFLAVFPDALPMNPKSPASFRTNPRVWDDDSGRSRQQRGPIDDVGFLSAVLDDIAGKYPIDHNRIYLTGFSSGASMTFHAASSALCERIAAAAPVSGHFFVSAATPAGRAVPLLLIFGTKDPLNPWEGGVGRPLWGVASVKPKVSDTVGAWAKFSGCPEKPALISDKDGVKRVAYGPGREGVEFLFWSIDGMGHRWPGGKNDVLPDSLVGARTDKLDATDAIWKFLSRHTLALRTEAP